MLQGLIYMKKHKKFAPVLISIVIILMAIVIRFYLNDKIISSEFKDKEFDNVFSRVLVHDFKSGNSVESYLTITINPIVNSSDCNIVVTFNNQKNNNVYKINNLDISIKPESGVILKRVYCDDGVSSENTYNISNDIFTARSKSDYFYLNIIVSNYHEDSIEFDLNYDICGQGIRSINKYKGFVTSVVI